MGVIRGGTELEQRVTALEDKFVIYDTRLDDLGSQLVATTSAIEAKVSGEQEAREKADQLTHDKLEAFSVGGIYIDMAGLWWLVWGILFATVPEEIVNLWCAVTRQLPS